MNENVFNLKWDSWHHGISAKAKRCEQCRGYRAIVPLDPPKKGNIEH